MAYLPDDEVDYLLKKFPLVQLTKKTITDTKLFKEKLQIIRSQGYATDDEETVEAVSAVSGPIFNHSGKVVAALAVGYISHTLSEDESERILRETVSTAQAISRSIGYTGQ
jgi:DNA-binding IclR family transcriptional regulator